jgi:hypothetical protein
MLEGFTSLVETRLLYLKPREKTKSLYVLVMHLLCSHECKLEAKRGVSLALIAIMRMIYMEFEGRLIPR